MSAALKHCGNLSTVSEASANVVRKIFPGLKSKCGNGKRKFDPSEECVIADQKRKKSPPVFESSHELSLLSF